MEVGHAGYNWRKQQQGQSDVTWVQILAQPLGCWARFSTSLSLSLLLRCKMGTNFTFSEEVLRTSNNVSHREPGWKELEATDMGGAPRKV